MISREASRGGPSLARRGITPVVALSPELAARAARRRIGPAAVRTSWPASPGGDPRVVLVPLEPASLVRLRRDPLLAAARVYGAENWEEWTRGNARRLRLRAAGRRLSIDAPPGKAPEGGETGPPPVRLGESPAPPLTLSSIWRPRRSGDVEPADAFWVPARSVGEAFTRLARAPAALWISTEVHAASEAGDIVIDARTALLERVRGAIPLRKRRLAAEPSTLLFCERELDVPEGLSSLECPGERLLATVRRGRVHLVALESPPVAAHRLLSARARRTDAMSGAEEGHGTDGETERNLPKDPRSGEEALDLGRWLRSRGEGPSRLERKLEKAFGPASVKDRGGQGGKPPAHRASGGGWRRYFTPRILPETVRLGLDLWGRLRVRRPQERRRVVERQRDALVHLLGALSGRHWQEALALAFPLRRPGKKEPVSRWLNADAALLGHEVDFSLEDAASKTTLGVVGVGPQIYERFRALYRRAAARYLEGSEYRRAAHVLSYLLGEHERAGAALEQGGFPREAATVYYHLAGKPRRAAVALEAAGLFPDAARIWMDLGVWRRAALCWEKARNDEQAAAAWRMVVMELRESDRLIQAAEVIAGRLEDPWGAVELLESCALALGSDALEAAEKALAARVELGERVRGRDLFRRLREAVLDDARRLAARRPLRRLLRLAAEADRWSRDPALSRAIAPREARELWLDAIETWCGRRTLTHPALRAEIDALAVHVAAEHGRGSGDPWLSGDVSRWARTRTPAPALARRAVESRTLRLSFLPTAFGRRGERLYAGGASGEVAVIDTEGREIGRLDTGTERPVTSVQAHLADLYASVDREVFHFEIEEGRLPRTTGRPLQVERTLEGLVHGLLLLPDGSTLLRVSTSRVDLLHPVHLRPLGTLVDLRDGAVAAAGLNRSFVALLLLGAPARGEREPGRGFAKGTAKCFGKDLEIALFHRRPGARQSALRAVERLPIDVSGPRRVRFFGREGDELLVVGDDHLVYYPARRTRATYCELVVGSSGSLPPPVAAGLPGESAALVAYGDGSLERIDLETKAREFLLDPPGGKADPVVGFELTERPLRAWILQRSGRLRRVELTAGG